MRKTKVQATANGKVLVLTIPKRIAQKLGVSKGTVASWIVRNGKVIIQFGKSENQKNG
ncbi:MAG: hypothetical protein RMI01_08835 [Thermodesulfovibrio sp.]|nr:hypothetical protein [Thermodesulfovibrio sp.]